MNTKSPTLEPQGSLFSWAVSSQAMLGVSSEKQVRGQRPCYLHTSLHPSLTFCLLLVTVRLVDSMGVWCLLQYVWLTCCPSIQRLAQVCVSPESCVSMSSSASSQSAKPKPWEAPSLCPLGADRLTFLVQILMAFNLDSLMPSSSFLHVLLPSLSSTGLFTSVPASALPVATPSFKKVLPPWLSTQEVVMSLWPPLPPPPTPILPSTLLDLPAAPRQHYECIMPSMCHASLQDKHHLLQEAFLSAQVWFGVHPVHLSGSSFLMVAWMLVFLFKSSIFHGFFEVMNHSFHSQSWTS